MTMDKHSTAAASVGGKNRDRSED
jgi:hypothetical protein